MIMAYLTAAVVAGAFTVLGINAARKSSRDEAIFFFGAGAILAYYAFKILS